MDRLLIDEEECTSLLYVKVALSGAGHLGTEWWTVVGDFSLELRDCRLSWAVV